MKTSTMNDSAIESEPATDTATGGSLLAGAKRAIENLRHANAERRLRRDLADLDDSILRDIGVATDEIGRVRAGEEFTPRNWRA